MKLDALSRDIFIALCGIENSSVKLHGGMSLKTFMNNQACAHSNAYTSYSNNTTALIIIMSQIEEAR